MPLYEVEHIFPLPIAEQDALAEAITAIHSKKFATPRLFVNVRFTLTTEARDYVAGQRRRSNRIVGHLRSGDSRSKDDFDELCTQLAQAWRETFHPKDEEAEDEQYSLRAVLILGGLVAGWEAGFLLPAAGRDAEWVKENLKTFKEKSANGNEDFQSLVREIEERAEFGGDPKLAEKRAEEKKNKEKKEEKK